MTCPIRGLYCLGCAHCGGPSVRAYHEERERRDQAFRDGRARSAGPAGASYVVEVITDPSDLRGLDARPVRGLATTGA